MASVVEGLNFPDEKKKYITNTLNPVLEEMVADLLSQNMPDPVGFMIGWLEKKAGPEYAGAARSSILEENAKLKEGLKKMNNTLSEAAGMVEVKDKDAEEEEEEEEEDDVLDEIPESMKKPEGQMKTARASVSAEAYGAWNQKKAFEPPKIAKSDEQKSRLKSVLENSFLFQSVESKEFDTLLDAMSEVIAKPAERVIKQGDDGDFLFVIEKGKLECKIGDKVVKTVSAGDVFGELALLYNCPRAANVDASEECVMWKLDRETFNYIVKAAAQKKRDRYDAFLKSVSLLSSMDDYQRSQIADALKPETYAKDAVIMKQGDEGNHFYILEEGTANATKDGATVKSYGAGDYFGELALLNNDPRAATITATSEVKVLALDRTSFKKMLGPLQDILAKSKQNYS